MTKLLILGIDGADFDILDPLFDQDRMPNLQRIADGGIKGSLRSTIPPSTCPGWQSFYTGRSPENVGIYGFRNFEHGSYDVHVPDSSDLAEPTYWEILGDEGYRTIVVGGPFTYPAQEIRGAMVAGPWTPSDADIFTHPPELSDEFRDLVEDYVFIPEEYEEHLFEEAFDHRTEVANHLARTRDWDVFTLVYRPDPLQHVYWDKDDDIVFQVYEYMDERIGEFLDVVEAEEEEEINILVMSDHGFEGQRKRYFHVNQWLEDEGYLKTKTDVSTSLMKYLPLEFGMNVASKLGFLDFVKRHFVPYQVKEAVSNPLHTIEWGESVAFFVWEQQTGQIYVNTEGRFPQGTVPTDRRGAVARDIANRLRSITDPDGNQVIQELWLGDDLYGGTYGEVAPDVVFTLTREYKGQGTFGNLFSTLDEDRSEGGHHIDGIFFAAGPDFRDGVVDNAEIIDVAPTILHLMDAPVEAGMDGEVLSELYAEGSDLQDRDIEYVEREGGDRKTTDWSDEQKDEVEGRLEDLGYL